MPAATPVSFSGLVLNVALVTLLLITVLTLKLDVSQQLVMSGLIVILALRTRHMVRRAKRQSAD